MARPKKKEEEFKPIKNAPIKFESITKSDEVDRHSRWVLPAKVIFPKEGEECLDNRGRHWRLLESTATGFVVFQRYEFQPYHPPDPKYVRWYNEHLLPQEVLDQYVKTKALVVSITND